MQIKHHHHVMREDCTKVVLCRGVVHVIDQLLGEPLQLLLRPG